VRVPNADWIKADREGLTICDATSAAFAQNLDWAKLDVVTFSWQKALGGEAAHGMLVLSPRAVARLESYTPAWPLPKIFRMTKGGKLNEGIFEARPSTRPRCCAWRITLMHSAGRSRRRPQGPDGARRCQHQSARRLEGEDAVDRFLAEDPAIRSTFGLHEGDRSRDHGAEPGRAGRFRQELVALVEKEGAGFDFAHYRDAPAGLRIWCGATVEAKDVALLTQWIDWLSPDQPLAKAA